MSERLEEFGGTTEVAVVTFTDPDNLDDYAALHGLTVPVLSDPTREAYRAYGLGRGSVARVWGWKAARRYIEIFRSDGLEGLRRPNEDTLQLGGDFVVDPCGNLSYGFWGGGPTDRPTVEDLLAAVAATRGS